MKQIIMSMLQCGEGKREFVLAKNLGGAEWLWRLWLPEFDVTSCREIRIFMERQGRQRIECLAKSVNGYERRGSVVEVDLTPMKQNLENSRSGQWRVYIGNEEQKIPIADEELVLENSKDFENKPDRFDESVGEIVIGEHIVEAIPYCQANGHWRLGVADRCMRYLPSFSCECNEARIRGNNVLIEAKCPSVPGVKWIGTAIVYRYQLENDREEYYYPAQRIQKKGNSWLLNVAINVKEQHFRPIYWDVRMVFEKDGETFWAFLKTRERGKSPLKNLVYNRSAHIGDEQLSISATQKGNVTLVHQKTNAYSGFVFRLKEVLAVIIYKMGYRHLRDMNIHLVYEKFCSMAQDNGYYFFKFCMENNMETVMNRRIFYVIDKNQTDYENVSKYEKNVIQFMSLKHMVYILACKLLISSDSKLHSYAWRSTESIIRPRILASKKNVFLQHGVIGLKRVEFSKNSIEGASLFITSNEREKGYIVDNLRYNSDEVVVTGLARWDVLEDRSSELEKKRILVMPTWRKWLEETTTEIFLKSEYYQRYMEFINAPALNEILNGYDLHIDFYIHPKFSEQIAQFSTKSDRIHIIPFGERPLNELIMKCKLLVTDYSSVAWDVFYQGKPVIFYQFDLEKYNIAHGSYMDMEHELFGDRSETEEDLIRELQETVKSGFELKSEYAKIRKSWFSYIDSNNSRRTCEEIMKKGW